MSDHYFLFWVTHEKTSHDTGHLTQITHAFKASVLPLNKPFHFVVTCNPPPYEPDSCMFYINGCALPTIYTPTSTGASDLSNHGFHIGNFDENNPVNRVAHMTISNVQVYFEKKYEDFVWKLYIQGGTPFD